MQSNSLGREKALTPSSLDQPDSSTGGLYIPPTITVPSTTYTQEVMMMMMMMMMMLSSCVVARSN